MPHMAMALPAGQGTLLLAGLDLSLSKGSPWEYAQAPQGGSWAV